MEFKHLFSAMDINGLQLQNRIVLPPMSVHMSEQGEMTEREIRYTERRAQGGCGLIIIGATYVEAKGFFPGQLGIEGDHRVEGLSRLVAAIHRYDTKAFIQLHHAGRETNISTIGEQPIAPSPVQAPGYDRPREMSQEEIAAMVECFAQGARRAKEAGFDGIELHGAHGYLIASFLSPHSNLREDEYGGSFQNRFRFLREIIQRTRDLVGENYPLSCRISGDELVENGIDTELAARIAVELEKMGICFISVSCHLSPFVRTVPNMSHTQGVNVYLAENVKGSVSIPVMTSGRINDPSLAEEILAFNRADLIGMGRALIADPDLPRKAKEGRLDTLIPCIGCNKGCHDRNKTERAVGCLLNPETGREGKFPLIPTKEKKKVLVVGGGPAGLEAARVAALRGHRVLLCEATGDLGGRLRLAAVPPLKGEYQDAVDHLIKGVKNQEELEIRLHTLVDGAYVDTIQPDFVVLATGSKPIWPNIPGLKDNPRVQIAEAVLAGEPLPGKKILVIGGGSVGAETAHYLSLQESKEIFLVEMLPEIGQDLPQDALYILTGELNKTKNLHVYVETTVLQLDDDTVYLNQQGEEKTIQKVDHFILAAGSEGERGLFNEISEKYSCALIGDASEAKDALKAIYEGWKVGRDI